MPFLNQKEFLKLYSSGFSMQDIANKQRVSLHKVAYWFKKYRLIPRTRSEAAYTKQNPNGDPFKIINIDNYHNKQLLALGIALYLGEGTKKDKYGIKLANSDPAIIKLFLNFLIKICGVKKEKFRAWINIFDDRKYKESLDFWSKQTGIPKIQFFSPVIRIRKSGSYKNKSQYGTITIVVQNIKLLNQIKSWCNEYLNEYAEVV